MTLLYRAKRETGYGGIGEKSVQCDWVGDRKDSEVEIEKRHSYEVGVAAGHSGGNIREGANDLRSEKGAEVGDREAGSGLRATLQRM